MVPSISYVLSLYHSQSNHEYKQNPGTERNGYRCLSGLVVGELGGEPAILLDSKSMHLPLYINVLLEELEIICYHHKHLIIMACFKNELSVCPVILTGWGGQQGEVSGRGSERCNACKWCWDICAQGLLLLRFLLCTPRMAGGNLELDKAMENDEAVPSSWCQWRDSHACVTSN